MLRILKSLNNNIILASNAKGEEVIIMGTGIGFQKKKNDVFESDIPTKVFKIEKDSRASQLLDDIPVEFIDLSSVIVQRGEKLLKIEINASTLFALADHLQFAIKRMKEKMEVNNPIQWEIPHLYPVEYQLGEECLALVKEKFELELPSAEASFIAMHFVNAQYDMNALRETVDIVKKVLTLLEYHFKIVLDTTTINYSRFITHLRYFIVRQQKAEKSALELDASLKSVIEDRYGDSFKCARKIRIYLMEQYGWKISEDELVYLTIHIERIVNENL